MKKCQYYGYSFKSTVIQRMSEQDKIALDAEKYTSIQEYPDDYTADDILPLIIDTFEREHPDFNLIDGQLVFL